VGDEVNLVVFRCGGWVCVMDPQTRQVGRLARGDSFVLESAWFSRAGSTW
jgi:hypothetical protein